MLGCLITHLEKLKKILILNDKDVLIQPIPVKNQQMKLMIKNEGSISGKNWEDYNKHKYIADNTQIPISIKWKFI